jgi:Holliday junction resolvase RusA-like endonuclease
MELEGHFIHVSSRPKPKERPRVSRRRIYTPEATLNAEQCIRDTWALSGNPTYDVPVNVTVIYTAEGQSIWVNPIEHPAKKWGGDVDNLLKLTLDGLQLGNLSENINRGTTGGAFKNDSLVQRIDAIKL